MVKNFKDTHRLLLHIGSLANKLEAEVYIVGGYLRDRILGIDGRDIDFTVINGGIRFARAVAQSLGVKNIVCFEKFGTCMVPYRGFKLEFVQARSEKYDSHSRKPAVEKGDLHTDLERRDFTINTLAQKLTGEGPGELIDLFSARKDLKKKILRTPLDPLQTFDDDPLRMIRAARFAAQLNCKLEKNVLAAARGKRSRISIVSQERITDEFVKIMEAGAPSKGLELLRQTGLLEILFPELQEMTGVEQRGSFHHKDVWLHTIKVVDNVAAVSDKLPLRLAALYHDVAKPKTKRFDDEVGWTFHGHDALGAKMVVPVMRRLKLPKEFIPYIQKLVRLHLRPISLSQENVTDSAIRRLIVSASDDLEDLLTLCRADITSGNPARVKKHLKNFDYVEKRIREVEDLDALRSFKSPVDGNEIMERFGLKPSPLIGLYKSYIEEAILDGIIPNEHDAAFDYLLKVKDDISPDEAYSRQKQTRSTSEEEEHGQV